MSRVAEWPDDDGPPPATFAFTFESLRVDVVRCLFCGRHESTSPSRRARLDVCVGGGPAELGHVEPTVIVERERADSVRRANGSPVAGIDVEH